MTEAFTIGAGADAAAARAVTDFVIFVSRHSDSVEDGGTNAARHSQQHSVHHVDVAACQLSESSYELGPCQLLISRLDNYTAAENKSASPVNLSSAQLATPSCEHHGLHKAVAFRSMSARTRRLLGTCFFITEENIEDLPKALLPVCVSRA